MSDERPREAKTYRVRGDLEGISVDVMIRAYVEDGVIQAIRSCRVTDIAAKSYPTINDGKTNEAGLNLTAMATMLRRLEHCVPGTYMSCPVCFEEQGHSHAMGCELDVLLKELP